MAKWERRAEKPPPQFTDRPKLHPWLEGVLDAFYDLSTERQIGMALGPIPRSKIIEYADEMELIGDAHDRFCSIIRQVDNEYLLMRTPKSAEDPDIVETVPASDGKAVRSLLHRLAKKPGQAPKRKTGPKAKPI